MMSTHADYCLADLVTDDPADISNETVLEQMASEPDCIDRWLNAPSSVCKLISLMLDRGLPRMDKSEYDDKLFDSYLLNIDHMREDFRMWAENLDAKGRVAVDEWKKQS